MSLPEIGYVRLPQIIGQNEVTIEQAMVNKARKKGPRTPRSAIPAIIPVSKSKWWAGVRSGRYPAPVHHLGERITAWKAEDIRAFIERSSGY